MEKIGEYLYAIREFTLDYTSFLIIFLYIGFLILFISLITYNYKYRKLLKKYNRLVRNFDEGNLEHLIIYLQDRVSELNANVNTLKLEIEEMNEEFNFAIQKIGFIKYNAFNNVGNEMSYSLAILDKFKNGFILTSIFGRDHNVNYSKEVKEGTPQKELSAEEIIALDRAIKSNLREEAGSGQEE